jgi:hypothetical protein
VRPEQPPFTKQRFCVYAQPIHMYPEPSTSPDDYPNPWRIRVRGHPARVKDIRWREAIRDEVKATYPQAPFAAPPSKTKFDVKVIFRMAPEDLARPAFDPTTSSSLFSTHSSPRRTSRRGSPACFFR